MIKTIATCDGPNCENTADVAMQTAVVIPWGSQTPESWIAINLIRSRQDGPSGHRGATGEKSFCSWKCVSNWALG